MLHIQHRTRTLESDIHRFRVILLVNYLVHYLFQESEGQLNEEKEEKLKYRDICVQKTGHIHNG